jgi:pimeloyl-ACP methyl ester carboxylesterase
MGTFSTTLATISAATYSNNLAGLPAGFTPLSLSGTVGGVFVNANAAASVTTGVLDGQSVVVLAFRGSDDRQDWLNNLRNINTDYAKFAPLIAAVEQYAAQNNLPVVVTGHSLGAGLAQVFMAEHPESGAVSYQAVTFGSPGALLANAPDARITNFKIADDLIPYVGEYRAEIGARASGNQVYANALAAVAVGASGSLTPDDVFASIPTFTASYVNRGLTVLLPDSDGLLIPFVPAQILDAADLVKIASDNQDRHSIVTYSAGSAAAVDPLAYVGGAEANSVKLWSLYDGFVLGGGLDVASASGVMADYTIARLSDGSLRVTDRVASRDGVDALSGVERLSFKDVVLAFDTDGTAGQSYRLYEAAFDRAPDRAGLTYWVQRADGGLDPRSIAASFVGSAEFQARYGAAASNDAFVTALYANALDRAPDAGGLSFWVSQLAGGLSRADVLVAFSESAENQAKLAPAIQNGIMLSHDWNVVA